MTCVDHRLEIIEGMNGQGDIKIQEAILECVYRKDEVYENTAFIGPAYWHKTV